MNMNNSHRIGEKMDFYDFECDLRTFGDKSYTILVISTHHFYSVNKETGHIEYKYYEFFDDGMRLRTL